MLFQPVVVFWYIFRSFVILACLKQTCTMLQFDNFHCGFLVYLLFHNSFFFIPAL